MYKAKHFLFKALLLFSIAFLLVVGCQFRLSANPSNSYEWSKTAKWKILSTHFHNGLIRIGFNDPLGSVAAINGVGDVVTPLILNGYMDKTGKQVIPPRFFRASDFSEGLASVRIYPEKKYPVGWTKKTWDFGYIDTSGKIKIKPQFPSADSFSDGLAKVYIKNKGYGYIDHQGKIIVTPSNRFIRLYSFHEGRAIVYPDKSNANFYLIDKKGQLIKPQDKKLACNENFTNDSSNDPKFFEGLLVVRKNSKYGYINREGKLAIGLKFDEAYDFSDGVARVVTKKNGKSFSSYINKQGEYILKSQNNISESFDFKEGLALAKDSITKKYGFIDKKGMFVIPPIFDTRAGSNYVFSEDSSRGMLARGFVEGVVRFVSDKGFIFINKSGKELFPRSKTSGFGTLVAADSFKEGLASISILPPDVSPNESTDKRHLFFVNQLGDIIIQEPK
jgi:WG containing repeat